MQGFFQGFLIKYSEIEIINKKIELGNELTKLKKEVDNNGNN